jgi:hypothetical protein
MEIIGITPHSLVVEPSKLIVNVNSLSLAASWHALLLTFSVLAIHPIYLAPLSPKERTNRPTFEHANG